MGQRRFLAGVLEATAYLLPPRMDPWLYNVDRIKLRSWLVGVFYSCVIRQIINPVSYISND